VKTWLIGARRRLSFANVTSAIALFIALGGTSYAAISIPRDSVGPSQIRSDAVKKSELARNAVAAWEIRHNAVNRSEIRSDAVGPSELRGNAVSSDEVADGGLEAADLSAAARTALNGIKYRVSSTAAGGAAAGNAKGIAHTAASGVYTVDLGADVSACQYAATVGGVKSGTTIEPPVATARQATASPSADATKVTVNVVQADGTPVDSAFHLLVAC
jgi:hypothetical protein